MKKQSLALLCLVAAIGVMLAGCGGNAGHRVTFREQGIAVSLRLPPGWGLLSHPEKGIWRLSPGGETGETSGGSTEIFDSQGKDLTYWVEEHLAQGRNIALPRGMSRRYQSHYVWKLFSSRPKKVGKFPAEEIVEQIAGQKQILLLAQKENRIVRVLFSCEPEDWKVSEPLFRSSLDSLKIK